MFQLTRHSGTLSEDRKTLEDERRGAGRHWRPLEAGKDKETVSSRASEGTADP